VQQLMTFMKNFQATWRTAQREAAFEFKKVALRLNLIKLLLKRTRMKRFVTEMAAEQLKGSICQ
jgi:hypothetical protein